jgi:hypothetical protein
MRANARTLQAASIALIAVLMGAMPRPAQAQSSGYSFTPLATIPGAAPGGGSFTVDFEPDAINSGGQVAFVADVTTGGEGVFLGRKGQLSQIVRTGDPAPGGGTFDIVEMGRVALNDRGDAAFGFTLSPFSLPIGVNAGLYRFSPVTNSLSAIIVPGATPAPGGGVFAGVNFHTSLNNSGDLAFSAIVPTTAGISGTSGIGVFHARGGQIAGVAGPGDPAPWGWHV